MSPWRGSRTAPRFRLANRGAPTEQDFVEYLTGLSRSSLLVLPYEPHAARSQSSGPFIEAAALGKPVVVPAGTWMSEQLAAGHAAGTIFAKPTAESVADSVIEALQGLDSFAAAAERIAPVIRKENSCQRVLERMLELATESPDMEPRYRLGENISFNDACDSRL
jgi:glycosyltransferase involved in cell wall biosynthesis